MRGSWYNTRTIDEVYTFSEVDVLPHLQYVSNRSIRFTKTYLGFTWYRSDAANLATFKGIDQATFSNVGVSHKSD